MNLQGKIVLVTGASRGIGEATAVELALQGARLLITARSESVLALGERLRSTGAEVEAIAGDVTDDQHVRKLVQTTRSKFGGIDALVNNAGILEAGKLGMIRLDNARRMFEVNVLATINLTQYAIRVFPREGGGAIVNLASIAGTQGAAGIAAYSASKAAVIGFTKAAAKELAPRRIRVNAIAPGFIETEIARQFSPEQYQRTVSCIGLGRIGQPSDIARAVAFLVSDDASYVTGQVLGVDGEMTV